MRVFVTYSDYNIVLVNSGKTFSIIFLLLFLAILLTFRRSDNQLLDVPTSITLKGIAVLFLIFGHLSIKCLQDKMFFDRSGDWAVIIFLFISGYGLYQSYELHNTKGRFWKRRISKLYIPLWITLGLFIFLDHILIDLHHPISEIVLNFLGFHLNGVLIRVNGVAWFVEYILVLYFLFWCVSALPVSQAVKIFILFLLCFLVHYIIRYTPAIQYHSLWLQYTIVFPFGVLVGKYKKLLQILPLKRIGGRLVLLFSSLILFAAFLKWDQIFGADIFRPLPMIFAIILVAVLVQSIKFQSGFLLFLGTYSYEIYLLHAPFMVKYDFFLYRKPLYLFFFAYFVSLLLLSYLLANISKMINTQLFMLLNKLSKKIE